MGLFATSFVVGLSGAVTPGPLFVAVVAQSTQIGATAGPRAVLGHGILELGLVTAIWLGLGPLLQQPVMTAIVGSAGGLVLLWFGQGMFRAARTASLNPSAGETSPSRHGPVLSGMIYSAANPYWILWWATIGLSYITVAMAAGLRGLASFYSGHILADLLWFGAVSFAIAAGRKIMDDSVYKWMIRVCGVFLVGLGGYFLVSTVRGTF